MRSPRSFVLGSVVLGALLSIVAAHGTGRLHAQASKPARPLTRSLVKENLYLVSGEGGNVALFATPEGVLLVDDMFDRNHADILAEVRAVSRAPLRYVVNTHQHDDHAGGDLKMLPLAEVIAHDNVFANLSDIKQPYYEDTPGTPIGLPRVTFADRMTVHLGAAAVQAHYFGRGHTSGDAVIYFPALKTVHTGDLFLARARPQPGAPVRPLALPIYADYAQGGSLRQWSTTLERMLALDFDTVISGHGPLQTRADVVRFKADVEAMRDRLTGLIRAGQPKAAIAKVLEDDYGWRATGCPPSPPTPGCLQFQQLDGLIDELRR